MIFALRLGDDLCPCQPLVLGGDGKHVRQYSVVLKQADTFFGDFWGQPEGSHVFWEGTVWHHLVAKFLDEILANSRGQAALFQVVEKNCVRLKMLIKLLNLLSVLSSKKEELK